MSLENLRHSPHRRYVERDATTNTAKIYAEARPTYEEWIKAATKLIALAVTKRDRYGNTSVDHFHPQLDYDPLYRVQYLQNSQVCIWVNVLCADEKEYAETVRKAREEAFNRLQARAQFHFTEPLEDLPGEVEEVIPEPIQAILDRVEPG